ncbi:hypothetical protein RRG08_009739, partial [Elysia crispata]
VDQGLRDLQQLLGSTPSLHAYLRTFIIEAVTSLIRFCTISLQSDEEFQGCSRAMTVTPLCDTVVNVDVLTGFFASVQNVTHGIVLKVTAAYHEKRKVVTLIDST